MKAPTGGTFPRIEEYDSGPGDLRKPGVRFSISSRKLEISGSLTSAVSLPGWMGISHLLQI
jgi:hypothetical protein